MKYDAFISYSHSDCGNIAPSIQRAIENIGKPWYQLKRNLNIFRDETNLTASPELWNSIVTELDNSDNLILLASPIAKDSHWVNKEVEHWFSKKRKGDLFIVLAEGNIIWDYSINDFDWKKTNCLPKAIIGKFTTEPLWIDLSCYINAGRESINYKQAGFTSSLTKIIGRIVGKPPREIESDELSRKRKTTFALFLSICIFIFLVLLGYNLNSQNNIIQRNSIANNLIAEGNKYRETNINKALLMYGYAYEKNNDNNTFKLLSEFYYKKCISIDTTHLLSGAGSEIVDTVNFIFSKIKSKEKMYKSNVTTDNLYTYCDEELFSNKFRKQIHLYLPLNAYYFIKGNELIFFDLKTNKKIHSQAIDLKGVTSYYTEPNTDLIILYYDDEIQSIDRLVRMYSISKKNTDDIIINHKIKFNSIDCANKSISYKIYDFNKLAVLIGQEDGTYSNKMKLFLSEGKRNTMYDLKFSTTYYSGWNEDFLFCLSNKNVKNNVTESICITTMNSSGQNQFYIYNLIENRETSVFISNNTKQTSGFSKDIISTMSFTEKNDYVFWGTNSGEINQIYFSGIINDDDIFVSKEKKSGLTGLSIFRDRFSFASNKEGIISIFENRNYKCIHSNDNNGEEIKLLKNIQLQSKSNISTIYYHSAENSLYVINNFGEIYKNQLNACIKLKKEINVSEIIKYFRIQDISNIEKEKLNISN